MKRFAALVVSFCLVVLVGSSAMAAPFIASEWVRAWNVGVNGVDWGDDIGKHPRMELQVDKGEQKMYTRRDFLNFDREHKERVAYVFTNDKFSGIVTAPLDKSGEYQQELKALIENAWGEAVPLEKLDPSKTGGYGWPIGDAITVILLKGNTVTIRNEKYE